MNNSKKSTDHFVPLIPARKLFFFIISTLLIGCVDERAELVAKYVESRGDVEIFNGFSLKHIRSQGTISAGDSLKILEEEYESKKRKFILDYNVLINTSQALKKSQEERNLVQAAASNQLFWISELEKRAAKGTSSALVYKQREIIALRVIANRMARYQADPGKALVRKAKVTYTIKNPLQNDAIQEMTRIFIFSSDNKEVLGVIE